MEGKMRGPAKMLQAPAASISRIRTALLGIKGREGKDGNVLGSSTSREFWIFPLVLQLTPSTIPSSLAVMNGSSHSPTAINGAPSTPNGFSNGPATSSTAALSNHQLPPACGARQLSKLKRFLTTLQQFGSDISPEIGERVRTLVLGLVVSSRLLWVVTGPGPWSTGRP